MPRYWDMISSRWQTGSWLLSFACPKESNQRKAPRTRTRVSVEREGEQAAASKIVKWGAYAAAHAPQASLTVSRQHPASPPLRQAQGFPPFLAKPGVCATRASRSNSARRQLPGLSAVLGGSEGDRKSQIIWSELINSYNFHLEHNIIQQGGTKLWLTPLKS